jgi:hypothetical protein
VGSRLLRMAHIQGREGRRRCFVAVGGRCVGGG